MRRKGDKQAGLFDSGLCYHYLEQRAKRLLPMNKKQQATLNDIFSRPTKANIRWSAVESLIRALGGTVSEREGSWVAAQLNGVTAVFHRPHPRPETKKGAVDAVRQFLTNAGVKP
ncbi:MAG: type II toxin-antitoxin system HicA family toxin [Terracidiphilus sp.]